ncbi:hypothetical protein [Microbacterium laevaniformans]|nr:hypothetical protein [Microbacterium laevaniformans]
MRSRGLAPSTIQSRVSIAGRFQQFTGEYPWEWTERDVEDYTSSLLSGGTQLAHSTIRGYHLGLRCLESRGVLYPRYATRSSSRPSTRSAYVDGRR